MKSRDTTLVGFANLLGRVTGMLSEMIMSPVFGAGMVADAFYAAFRVPQLLRELLAEGSLQNAFVPAFSEASEKEGLESAWRLANAFLGLLLLVLGGTVVMFFFGAPFFVHLVASGFADNPEKFDLTVSLTRWMSPFLAGLSLAGFIGAMLNVRGKFFAPAMAQNLFNLLVIAACLGAKQFEAATGLPGITAVAIAATLSGFLQVALTLPPLLREGFRIRPTLGGHPAIRRMLAFLGPALIGISTVQFNVLIESNWASDYGDGPVSYLMKSFRFIQIPLAVFSGSIATTALAGVALHVARREEKETGDTLARALRTNAFLVIPSAVAFGVLAEPLVRLLYERGEFSPENTAGTALMLRMYAFAVFGICTHRLAVPLYYALGDPRRPMWMSIAAMAAKIPVILFLTKVVGLGVEALPLSHAITVSGECLFLGAGLAPRVRGRGLLSAHLRIGVAAAVMGGVAWALAPHLHVVLVCAIAGGTYLVVAKVLGVEELSAFGKMRSPGLPPSIDPETREALVALVAGSVAVVDGRVTCPRGSWRIAAKEGEMTLIPDGEGVAGPLSGPVQAILKPGRPPTLKGFVIGDQAWHVEGDAVMSGDYAGPHLPVR